MSDERELRQLYQAMRSEDARQAPSFARVAALARPTAANLGRLRALAITVALVVVAVLVSVNALRRPEQPPHVAQAPAVRVETPAVTSAPTVAAVSPSVEKKGPRRPKPKPAPSINDWKSPTDAWLQTPDEAFRNSVPSLQYSSVKLSD